MKIFWTKRQHCGFVWFISQCLKIKQSNSWPVGWTWILSKSEINNFLCYTWWVISVGFPYMKLMNVITNSDVTNLYCARIYRNCLCTVYEAFTYMYASCYQGSPHLQKSGRLDHEREVKTSNSLVETCFCKNMGFFTFFFIFAFEVYLY